jgi:hypothetical protein
MLMKRNWRTNKHVEIQALNIIDEWWRFLGFDTNKYIVDPYKNEHIVLDLVDILAMLILQMAQKDANLYAPTKYVPLNLIL